MKRQKGFAHVQILLALVVVAIIGGVGFFVYNAQKDTNKTLDTAANAVNDPQSTKKTNQTDQNAVKEEDSWLLFTPDDGAYTVRVPDGWKTVSLNGNLYNRDANFMAYKKGTKATVEMLTDGGWDGATPFSLTNPGAYYTEIVRQGTESGTVKTDAGLVAHKYIYIEQNEPEAIGYAKGTKVYNYYFDADGIYIQVSHAVSPGETDQSVLVERMLKTITVK
jgi:type II secretory pathway pseudopilin PulG